MSVVDDIWGSSSSKQDTAPKPTPTNSTVDSIWGQSQQAEEQSLKSKANEPFNIKKDVLELGIPRMAAQAQYLGYKSGEGAPLSKLPETYDLGISAALSVLPVEKILGPIVRPITKPVIEALRPIVSKISEPVIGALGKVLTKYAWQPLSEVSGKFFKKPVMYAVDELTSEESRFANQQIKDSLIRLSPKESATVEPIFNAATKTTNPLQVVRRQSLDPRIAPNPNEHEFTTLKWGDTVLNGFADTFNISRGSAVYGFKHALFLMDQKAQAGSHVQYSAAKLMESFGKHSDTVWNAIEDPNLIKQLPTEMQRIPSILKDMMTKISDTIDQSGLSKGFIKDYIPHYFKDTRILNTRISGTTLHDILSDYVTSGKHRTIHEIKSTLKSVLEGGQTSSDLERIYGVPANIISQLRRQSLSENSTEDFLSYIRSWVKAEGINNTNTVLKSISYSDGMPLLTGAMDKETHALTKSLIDNAEDRVRLEAQALGTPLPNKLNALKNIGAVLDNYKKAPLEYGDVLYHPDIAKAIVEKQAAKKFGVGSMLKSILSFSALGKQLRYSLGFFHAGNFAKIMNSSGEGFATFAFPNMTKQYLQSAEHLEIENRIAKAAGNLFGDKDLVYRLMDKFDQQAEGLGDQFRFSNWLRESAPGASQVSQFTFQHQGRAYQSQLFLHHVADITQKIAQGVYPSLTSEEIDKVAAQAMNYKMGSLSADAMAIGLKDLGRMFYVARDWTLSNMGTSISAFQQWAKPLMDSGVLPKEVGSGLNKWFNAIQNIDHLSPEAQGVLQKQLADFVGVSVMQNVWRSQILQLMMKGSLTYSNPPGYENSIATGHIERVKTSKGYVPHEKFVNINGWLNDFYNMIPADLKLPERVDQIKAKDALKYININPVKPLQAQLNKESILGGILYDTRKAIEDAKAKGLPPTETFVRAVLRAPAGAVTPVTFRNAVSEYRRTGHINDFFYSLAFGVLGNPQQSLGPSPQTLRKETKGERKSIAQQVIQGLFGR